MRLKSDVTAGRLVGESRVAIAALRVEFQADEEEGTTGNGLFDLSIPDGSEDGFVIDPPPHNRAYFKAQIAALANYYAAASGGKLTLDVDTSDVFPAAQDSAYSLSDEMRSYNPNTTDEEVDTGIARLFYESVLAAAADGVDFSLYDAVVIFHAGVGKDFSFLLDLTPFDIPSSYVDSEFLSMNLEPLQYAEMELLGATRGIILPETQSQEGYRIGLTGTFALLFGSYLGLPVLWNAETGASGIGMWGLMDQGSNNMDGVVPALPSAFMRVFMGWEEPVTVRSGEAIAVTRAGAPSGTHIYKVPISAAEYYLVENRQRDAVNEEGSSELIIGGDTVGVELDPNGTGVVVRAEEYDAGIPGEGLLIWHVDESIVNAGYEDNAINIDPDRKGVFLEEGDGSFDIGEEFGFLQPGSGSENGSPWDPFYARNPAWYFQNPDWQPDADSTAAFTPETNPATVTNGGAYTGISFTGISARGEVMTFDLARGNLLAGFPLYLGAASGEGSPLVADLDGNGEAEIITAVSDGSIHAWTVTDSVPSVYMGNSIYADVISVRGDTTARERLGIFAYVPGGGASRLALDDIDRDNVVEVVAATAGGIVALYKPEDEAVVDGIADTLWAYDTGRSNLTTPLIYEETVYAAAADGFVFTLDAKGAPISINQAASEANSLHLMASGLVVALASEAAAGYIYPGTDEMVEIFLDGTVIVSGSGGERTYDTGDSVYSSPALADIDGDGNLEIIVTGNNKLWAFNGNMTLVANFPVTVNAAEPVGAIMSSPVVGDIDLNGDLEIVFGAPNDMVYAYHHDGTPVRGFPLATGGAINSTPTLCDVNKDGMVEVIAASDDGYLYAWSVMPAPGVTEIPVFEFPRDCRSDAMPWLTFAGSNARTNRALTPETVNLEGPLLETGKVFVYPNPVTGETARIRYFVNDADRVEVRIYDLAGDYVGKLVDRNLTNQEYNEIEWDVRGIQSGIYLARVEAYGAGGSASKLIKIAVVK